MNLRPASFPPSIPKATSAPLHAGAVRYYREIGVEVPARLLPPEAR